MSFEKVRRSVRLNRWQWALIIALLSGLVHVWTAWQLPLDADEPVYMNAGADYARLIRAGDWNGVIQYQGNSEHPALVKLLYSLPFVMDPVHAPAFEINRAQSAVFGTLAVFILALVDPVAGVFLAFHSMFLKYTSEVYLEALPFLAALAAVLAFQRGQSGGKKRWYILSAIALGTAGAGKFTYLFVAWVILSMAFLERKPGWKGMLAYIAGSVAAFILLNPSLWGDPVGRLTGAFSFHVNYAQGSEVLRLSYPWYQPVAWMFMSVPWHPQVFFFPTLDVAAAGLAIAGLGLAWKQKPYLVIWLVGGLGLLLIWPTKWPQYSLLITPATCLTAGLAVRWGWRKIRESDSYYNWIREVLPDPHPAFYILLGLFLSALLVGKVGYELQMAQARRGWAQFSSAQSPLPSDAIFALSTARDGRMAIGTGNGVMFWTPGEDSPWGTNVQRLGPDNSPLPDSSVYAILEAQDGSWWFGTDNGLARLQGKEWSVYRAADIGLDSARIRALAQDGKGRIWVGTLSGAAQWDGSEWRAIQSADSGLAGVSVFDLTDRKTAQGEEVWFATLNGLSRLDLTNDTWQTVPLGEYTLGWRGVTGLMVDHLGRLWAATHGAGIVRLDGQTWTTIQATEGGLPQNVVNRLVEAPDGSIWVGMGYSSVPGGILAHLNRETWKTYTPSNSGFGGAEPSALTTRPDGELWIGTAASGLQIYSPQP